MSSIYIYTTLELVINMIFVLAQYVFFNETSFLISVYHELHWPQLSPHPRLLQRVTRAWEAEWKLLVIYEGTF